MSVTMRLIRTVIGYPKNKVFFIKIAEVDFKVAIFVIKPVVLGHENILI